MGRNSQHSQGSQPSGSTGRTADDQAAHEAQAVVQGGHSSRVEEWRDPQAPAEGEPRVSWTPEVPEQPGTPAGMTNEDVEHRSEIARFLGKGVWPADRETLVATARDNGAPDTVVADLSRLPDGSFGNLQEVSRALGIGTERERDAAD
jgi:general stress protein YciG